MSTHIFVSESLRGLSIDMEIIKVINTMLNLNLALTPVFVGTFGPYYVIHPHTSILHTKGNLLFSL